jgi:hypothetical protein
MGHAWMRDAVDAQIAHAIKLTHPCFAASRLPTLLHAKAIELAGA